jgi:hypothetical protein
MDAPFWVSAVVCTVLPVLLVLAALVLLVVLPLIKAPSYAAVEREARKQIEIYPNITRSRLEQNLREEYLPAWALHTPDSGGDPADTNWFLEIRWYVARMVIDSRIDRAIESIRDDEGEREARERHKRRKRKRTRRSD